MSFSEAVAAIGGLLLVIVAIICFTVLAVSHVIDGAAAIGSILAVLGISGGTVAAHKAIAVKSNHDDAATPRRRVTDV